MYIDINSIRILNPSPTTFILDVEQTSSLSDSPSHVTYIGSGEHCFKTASLVQSKLAHSTTFSTTSGVTHGDITAYALFDMNDVLIGTDTDFSDDDTVYADYMLAPIVLDVDEKRANPILGIPHNKNSFVGVIPGINRSTLSETPSRKYDIDGILKYSADKDAITLYNKQASPASTKQILRAYDEYDITPTESGDKLDQLFVIQTFHAFDTDGSGQQPTQNITATWAALVNNFDDGVLSAASFLTPKQTLNAEYSTAKSTLSENQSFEFMRSYTVRNSDKPEFNMYASGNLLILNYLESKRLAAEAITTTISTQISTTYSKYVGLTADTFGTASAKTVSMYPDNITTNHVAQNYLPEVVNLVDDGFGGGESTGTTTAHRAIHKANIFDIEIATGAVTNESKFNTVMSEVPSAIATAYSKFMSSTTNITASLKTALHNHISDSLQKLVVDLIPAHTHLYRVVTSDNDSTTIDPTVTDFTHPFSVLNGMLFVNYEINDTNMPYTIIFDDDATDQKIEMTVSLVNNEITLQLSEYSGFADSVSTIILPGTRRHSGTYRLYVYNGEIAYRQVSYEYVPGHPFTVIDGELHAIYGENSFDPIAFVDLATDELYELTTYVDSDTSEVHLTLRKIDNDNMLRVVTTLPLVGTGENAGEYILYVNNGNAQFTYVKRA